VAAVPSDDRPAQPEGRDEDALAIADVAGPYLHIACCLDESPGSLRALQEARRLRSFGHGRLTIVHVRPSPIVYGESLTLPPDDDLTAAASAWLNAQLEHVAGAESILLSGHAGGAVCDWARQARPDLLIAGAHRGRLARLALGSFAGYVAYHAPCNVLLVRPDAQ
jgi:nucleotide-binding universal stress UspA family protein